MKNLKCKILIIATSLFFVTGSNLVYAKKDHNAGNPPGKAGGAGAGARWTDNPNKRDNSPGPAGGEGTDWQRPPGWDEGKKTGWDGSDTPPGFENFKKRADTNQDGVIDDTEREQAQEKMKERFQEKADQNQDGLVDEQEKAKAKKVMKEKFGGNPPGPKGGPGSGKGETAQSE